MRAGPGSPTLLAVALVLCTATADAQSALSSKSSAPLPGASLPGALMSGRGVADVEFEYSSASLEDRMLAASVKEDDDEDDDEAGGMPGFFGLGGQGSGRRAAALTARGGRPFAGVSLPGLGLLKRAVKAEIRARQAERVAAAAFARLGAEDRAALALLLGGHAGEGTLPAASLDAGGRGAGTGALHASVNASTASHGAPTIPRVDLPGGNMSITFDPPTASGNASAAGGAVALVSETAATAAAVVVTPEPASLALLGTGVAALGFMVGRRRR